MSEMSPTLSYLLRRPWRRNARQASRKEGRSFIRWLFRLLLLPFRLAVGLVGFIIGLAGRAVAFLLGAGLLVVGALLSLTIVGALLGIPLALFGLLLMVKALS
jgi:hypothetical protein